MSEIRMTQAHALPLAKAKAAAQAAADELASEYGLSSEWEGDTLHFRRSGVDGTMHVVADRVDLVVRLGLLLRPFRAAFEEHLRAHLAKRLAAPAARSPRSKT